MATIIPRDVASLYEELREIIDSGSESATHEDAVANLIALMDADERVEKTEAVCLNLRGELNAEQNKLFDARVAHEVMKYRVAALEGALKKIEWEISWGCYHRHYEAEAHSEMIRAVLDQTTSAS